MSELIDRKALENWLRTECYGTDTYDDKEYVIGRLREELPTVAAPRWHRVEDGLPKDGQCCLFFTIESGRPERDAWFGIYRNYWEVDINMRFDYWMPIEPPKEDA